MNNQNLDDKISLYKKKIALFDKNFSILRPIPHNKDEEFENQLPEIAQIAFEIAEDCRGKEKMEMALKYVIKSATIYKRARYVGEYMENLVTPFRNSYEWFVDFNNLSLFQRFGQTWINLIKDETDEPSHQRSKLYFRYYYEAYQKMSTGLIKFKRPDLARNYLMDFLHSLDNLLLMGKFEDWIQDVPLSDRKPKINLQIAETFDLERDYQSATKFYIQSLVHLEDCAWRRNMVPDAKDIFNEIINKLTKNINNRFPDSLDS
ncbi:MAG: hypothetical protein GPJ54_02190 [Candidatus Heimdallarchaeota archaeon]|nr:hypothetical protein [Candidatus Heimdallarchaeota archaeon]